MLVFSPVLPESSRVTALRRLFKQRPCREPKIVCEETGAATTAAAPAPCADTDDAAAHARADAEKAFAHAYADAQPRLEVERPWRVARAAKAVAIAGMFLAASAFVFYIDAVFHSLNGMHVFLYAVASFQLFCCVLFAIHLAAPRWYRALPATPVSNCKFRILRGLWLAPLGWLLVTFLATVPMDLAARHGTLLPTPLIRATAFVEGLVSRRFAAAKVATMRDIALRKGELATARRLHGIALFWARRMKVTEQEVGDPVLYEALKRDRRAMAAFALAKYRLPEDPYWQFEALMAAVTLDRHGHSDAADVIYSRLLANLPLDASLSSLPFPLPISEERMTILMEHKSLMQYEDNRKSVRDFLVYPGSRTAFGTTLLNLNNRTYDLRPADRRHEIPVVTSAYGMSYQLGLVDSHDLRSKFQWAEPIWNSDKYVWNPAITNLGQLVSPDPQPLEQTNLPEVPEALGFSGLPLQSLRMEQNVLLTEEQSNQLDSIKPDILMH